MVFGFVTQSSSFGGGLKIEGRKGKLFSNHHCHHFSMKVGVLHSLNGSLCMFMLNLVCIMFKALCSLAFLACVLGVDLGGSLSCFF